MATRNKTRTVSGLRPFPREKPTPVSEMSKDALLKLKKRNDDALRSMSASSSTYIARVQETQSKVLHRLAEIEGMESIQHRLRRATISEDAPMSIESVEQPKPIKYQSRFQRALNESLQQNANAKEEVSGRRRTQKTIMLDLDESIALEQRQFAFEQERRARAEARRQRMMPSRQAEPGRFKTQAEYEAAVWKFMSYKPSESDMEDDDDDYEDPENEDPATYFDDEEDDGIKGQNIVYPDAEDMSDVIRVTNQIHYSTFYEPRDDY